MEIFVFPPTPNSARVLAMLGETGAEAAVTVIDLPGGGTADPAFRAKVPAGTLPALVDGDLVLTESRAIMLYLALLAPGAGLYPADARGRAEVHQWLDWHGLAFAPAMEDLVIGGFLGPMTGRGADPERAARGRARLPDLLGALEARLAGREGVAGAVSLADIAIAGSLVPHAAIGIDLAPFPEIRRWLEAMLGRPAVAEAHRGMRAMFGI